MMIARRKALQVPLALAALMLPFASRNGFSQARTVAPPAAAGRARWDRTLVLIELKGGNDGLNTLVPFADPAYAKLRPALQIAGDRLLKLDERVGLNPALAALRTSWQARDLAIVQ